MSTNLFIKLTHSSVNKVKAIINSYDNINGC